MISGSRRVIFGADHFACQSDVVIVEGEFDAMLVWQEVHDRVDVLTMGAARGTPRESWLCYLLPGQHFYVMTDIDQAGDEAAARWLELVGKRGSRHIPPTGKDVSEFWQNGGNVRQWISELILPHMVWQT